MITRKVFFQGITVAVTTTGISTKAKARAAPLLSPKCDIPARDKDWEQENMRVVACLMAAEGHKSALEIRQGHWLWTVALDAVQVLRLDRDRLAGAIDVPMKGAKHEH